MSWRPVQVYLLGRSLLEVTERKCPSHTDQDSAQELSQAISLLPSSQVGVLIADGETQPCPSESRYLDRESLSKLLSLPRACAGFKPDAGVVEGCGCFLPRYLL